MEKHNLLIQNGAYQGEGLYAQKEWGKSAWETSWWFPDSHDLRTPLTSVLLYAEILQSGKCKDEKKRQDYLHKMVKKIQYMKELADKLLAYAVRTPEEKLVAASYLSVRGALYDELSDMCSYLEEQGRKVKANLQWWEGYVFICEEHIVRILDNVASNIMKYADAQAPVLIWDEYGEGEMFLTLDNARNAKSGSEGGYGIGIRNVQVMMQQVKGRCEVTLNEGNFRTCLRFRYKDY